MQNQPQAILQSEHSQPSIQDQIIATFGNGELGQEALCIARNESGFDPSKWNTKGNKPAGSRDRGVFMINDYWHSEVSDAQAFNASFNIAWAYKTRVQDGNWHQWATHTICHVN